MPLQIGPYKLKSRLLLAPMAGITDKPYRDICRKYGAGLVSSEMITSDLALMKSKKTKTRLIQIDEPAPRSVQILGNDPNAMAEAAQLNVELGANIIDINMGCPAKKVCNKAAGSALLQDPKLVKEILSKVVNAIDVPVTLKIRTGQNYQHRNAIDIAKIAEDCGIASLAIHGRTRQQAFTAHAEYETIRQIKCHIDIPVIANGDVKNINDVKFIFDYTQADGLMLGRITRGQPWIFNELNEQLLVKKPLNVIFDLKKKESIIAHIYTIHRFYGYEQGVRIARKHIGWYLSNLGGQNINWVSKNQRIIFMINDAETQLIKLEEILESYIV